MGDYNHLSLEPWENLSQVDRCQRLLQAYDTKQRRSYAAGVAAPPAPHRRKHKPVAPCPLCGGKMRTTTLTTIRYCYCTRCEGKRKEWR